ncbi:glutamine-hydrolyzing GMP synthase subunit GuaA [Candidatus Micrarchaeota archaeon]|nr:glutamine-hydrolyzing GMP synthase subunit GuaA [Candidatus Micrarchaeota archaeon]
MAFNPEKFIEEAKKEIINKISGRRAIIALSGGVDSMVAATLTAKSIPNLTAVFVDTGLVRKGEPRYVERVAEQEGINLRIVDAKEEFLSALEGISEPEEKRKIIGELFIRIFERIAREENADFLVQGTIAPDWIESGEGGRRTIKSHHNVGGLPEKMHIKLCEPLRELYKHEVRLVGKTLGFPEEVFNRQPFPGPGLAVRVVGKITRKKIEIVRDACFVVETEIEKAVKQEKMEKPWQYFAAVLPVKTVGVAGDERTYKYPVVVRAVGSLDGMTANFSEIPYEVLKIISTRITNEIPHVGRVFFDLTNKPPGTIEME